MSEFVVCDVIYSDLEILKKSLIDLGVPAGVIEVHESPVTLNGYHGASKLVGHVVIKAGASTNRYDIGFERTAAGYSPRVVDMDSHNIGGTIMRDLKQKYAEVTVTEIVKKKHGCKIMSNQKDKDGKVRIRMRV